MIRYGLLLTVLPTLCFSQTPDAAFFEAKIRPVLATKCYACHASTLKAPMGGLVLDTKAGVLCAPRRVERRSGRIGFPRRCALAADELKLEIPRDMLLDV